jgi:hypothetical protein
METEDRRATPGSEQVYAIIGGVPFPATTVAADGLPQGCDEVALLGEDVGDPDMITPYLETTYFSTGTLMPVRWDGERHPSDGLRMLRLRG